MPQASRRGTEESPWAEWLLITIALAFCSVFLLLPLLNVFGQALAKGWAYYWAVADASGHAGGHPADAAGGGHQRAAERGLRFGGGLGDRQVRVPRQVAA